MSTHFLTAKRADTLHVSRAAMAKGESGRGFPDIGHFLAIRFVYPIRLDPLFQDESALEEKLVADSRANKWN